MRLPCRWYKVGFRELNVCYSILGDMHTNNYFYHNIMVMNNHAIKYKSFGMKRNILIIALCFIMMFVQSICPVHGATDSISYLRIDDLEYKDGKLFLLQKVKSDSDKDGTGEEYRQELSDQEAQQFLRLVAELELTDIQSNDSKKSGEFPFEASFVKNNRSGAISAYKNGMSDEEKVNFGNYVTQIRKIIHRGDAIKALLASLPDGQYEIKDAKRYEFRIGPKGWASWEKNGDTIKQLYAPLVVIDGEIVDIEMITNMNPDDIKSFSILKAEDAMSIYGEQAQYGVMLIESKKK